jgi:hypothetical protein
MYIYAYALKVHAPPSRNVYVYVSALRAALTKDGRFIERSG